MADPAGMDPWDLLKAAWGLIITFLGYLGLRARGDIDQLQRDAVQKGDHEKAISRIEDIQREHRQETRESFSQVFERLNAIADRLNGGKG